MGVRVVVLGMHRSGTSAAARVVNLLGVPLGDRSDWMPPNPSNPAGYWESASLTAWNDQVLEALGGSWAAPPALQNGVWKTPEIKRLQRQATARFRAVHPTESWVWKDPRNCLTLPFWRPVLSRRPVTVLVFRDPGEVASSLAESHGCSRLYGLALWERYVRTALANAVGLPTFVLGYAELLADPRGAAARLDEFLRWAGLERSESPELEAISAFIDPQLHRARADGDGCELSAAQQELARRLAALAGPHQRLAAVALPAETPLTEVLLREHRTLELRAGRLEGALRQLEERTGHAEALAEARATELERASHYARDLESRLAERETEALAEARAIELERAAPYARELESRLAEREAEIAERETEIADLRALAEGQGEALGLRLAEVESLGAALAERSALAARHLIENRRLWAEVDRAGKRVEELGQWADELRARSAELDEWAARLDRQGAELGQWAAGLGTQHEDLGRWNAELGQWAEAIGTRGEELGRWDQELVRWAEEIGGRDRQLAEWAEDLGKRDRELAECAQDLGKRDRELAELAGALRTRAEARRPGAYGLGRRGALPEVPVDPAAGWRQPVVAQSILLWTFPHGSRRRAACEALLGTLAAMRRAR